MTFNYTLGGIINPLGQALKCESISFISNCLTLAVASVVELALFYR